MRIGRTAILRDVSISDQVDGRTVRAERNRRAIVDAMLELLEEGDIAPTAARIATRAGTSPRTLYQHFDDMESLFAAASRRQLERVLELHGPIDVDAPLERRIELFVVQRSRILEAITPIRRSALLQEHSSFELRRSRDRFIALAQAEVGNVFALELGLVSGSERRTLLAALDVAMSWNAWDWLRTTGLSVEASRQVMRRTVLALVAR